MNIFIDITFVEYSYIDLILIPNLFKSWFLGYLKRLY